MSLLQCSCLCVHVRVCIYVCVRVCVWMGVGGWMGVRACLSQCWPVFVCVLVCGIVLECAWVGSNHTNNNTLLHANTNTIPVCVCVSLLSCGVVVQGLSSDVTHDAQHPKRRDHDPFWMCVLFCLWSRSDFARCKHQHKFIYSIWTHYLEFIYVNCLVMSVTWLIITCDVTTFCVRHDSFILLMRDMTRSYVWRDSFTCVTLLFHVWHAYFIRVAWLIHIYDIIIYMCDMPHSYVWHDSLLSDMMYSYLSMWQFQKRDMNSSCI